ncbi:MAG: type I secretion C-terminal target domain-containing protein [Proteobacteria bacterium]|nr:MAG: type I secretion C-terminal target domain-containing protein [Pseudomonadota bacterium]
MSAGVVPAPRRTPMAINQPVATVVAVTGEAYARNADGVMRALKAGDALYEGEVLITRNGGRVELATSDGQLLEVQPNESVAITAELSDTTRPTPQEAAVGDASIERVVQALEQGGDIDDALEAPAAGLAGGAGGEGNSFVRLLRITEGVDPLSFEFATAQPAVAADFDGGAGDDAEAVVPEVLGTLSISGPANVVEGESATYTISVDRAPTSDLIVNIVTGHITTSNGDVNLVTTSVTIPAGATSATFTISTIDDAYADSGEQFRVGIGGASGGGYDRIVIGSGQTVTTILDQTGSDNPPGAEDTATVTLSGPSTVTEGGDASYTVSIDHAPATDLTLDITLTHIDTVSGDIVSVPATVTIPAGSTSAAFNVSTFDDNLHESGENYSISIGLPATPGGGFENLVLGSSAVTTTIVDNDTPSFSINDVTVNEAAGTATFTVTLSNPSASTVTVDYASANGTAVAGAAGAGDYDTVGGTLSFAPGVTTQTITVNINNDAIYEISEQFAIDLSNPTGGAVIGDGQGIGTIRDDGTGGPPGTDNDIPAVSISGPVLVNEAAGTLTYTVSLTNPSDHPVTVDVATANGSAQAGSDYTALSQSLTFAPGVTSQTVTVAILNDSPAVYEGAEDYTVALSNVAGAVIGTGSVTTTIVDDGTGGPPGGDDDRPVISIAGPAEVNEGAGTITYTLNLSNPSANAVSVTVDTADAGATAGADYSPIASQVVTFAPGATSATVTVSIVNDTVFEGAEAYRVNLSAPTGGASIGTGSVTTTIRDDGTGGPPGTDDDTPVISITGPAVVNEAAGTVTYTVSLSNPSTSAVTVGYASADGTAIAGAPGAGDYDAVSGTLTFAPGVTSQTITLTINNDATYERAEDYSLNLTGPVGATIGTGSVTTTIRDDGTAGDPPTTGNDDDRPAFSINDVTVNEGAGTATFTVTLSNPSALSTTVDFATADGSALSGADYTGTGGTLTFAPGVTSQTITVAILNDAVYEGSEQFVVNLSNATADATIADAQGVGTIVDDGTGGPPGSDNDIPTLSVSSPTVTEGTDAHAVFTVSLSNPSVQDVSVSLALADVSATNPADYGAGLEVFVGGAWVSATAATIPAGSTSVQVRTPIANDNLAEGNETFTLNATVTGGTTTNPAASGTGTIVDDDTPSFSINDVTVNEAAGTATFTVTLSNPSASTVTVDYASANGTAVAGAAGAGDYDTVGGTLSFAPGVTTQTITVNINNDAIYEISEQFAIDLSNPTGGAVIGDGQGIGTIRDDGTGGPPGTDNDIPAVSISGPVLVNEAAGTLTYTVSLTNPSDHPVTVDVATANGSAQAGSDYTALSQSLTFAPGVTSQTVTVAILNDSPAVYEGAEDYTVALSNVAGAVIGTGSVTTTIVDDGTGGPPGGDDDRPVISIVGPAEVNEGAGTITYTLNLSNPSANAVSVTVDTMDAGATAGADYSPIASQVITFAPGSTSATVTVNIVNDSVFEGAEAYQVNLSAPTGGASIGTGSVTTTIRDDGTGGPPGTDDDTPAISINDVTVNESAGTATFTVTLSNPSNLGVSVSYSSAGVSATQGVDYTGVAGTLNFPAGVTSQTITVPITDDAYAEGDETFNIVLSNPVNATIADDTGVGTITDDTTFDPVDTATLTISGAGTVVEGESVTYTVSVDKAPATDLTVNVVTGHITTDDGDLTPVNTSVIIAAGTTSATFVVNTTDDALADSGEQYTASISGSSGGGYENLVLGTSSVTTTIVDQTGSDNPPGPEDTVYVRLVNSASVSEGIPDATLSHRVELIDQNGNPVTVPAGGSVTVTLTYSADTTSAADFVNLKVTTVTIGAGQSFALIENEVFNDTLDENDEGYTLSLATVSSGVFEHVQAHATQNTVTGTIIDNDAPPVVASVVGDDDNVDENRDASPSNDIVQVGTIQNVGSNDVVTLAGNAAGVTSNGLPVSYAWDAASKTLTASSAEGVVFTLRVNASNSGYTFTQVRALDHLPTVQGESESKVLGFTLSVDGGISTANFNVTVFDDAPTVDGPLSITAANQLGQTVMGSLPVTVSNDPTDLTWNPAGATLPTLYADGKQVQYEWNDSNDALTGYVMNGSVRENVLLLDLDLASKTYVFNTFAQLLGGTVSTSDFSGTTGGNSGSLQIIDANNNVILIDATGVRNGAAAQVNYSAQGISVNGGQGNWIDAAGNEVLTLTYTRDITSATFSLEPQAQSATMSWAAYRDGVLVASGSNVSIGKSNPEQLLTISAGEAFDTVTFTAVSGEFRPEIVSISYINYNADVSMNLAYQLRDADADTAQGTIALNLSGTPAPSISASAALVSEEGLSGGNPDTVGSPTDLTNSVVFTGSMNISGAGTLSVGLHPPAQGLTSGGAALTWTGVGTGTLTGSANGSDVVRVTMQANGNYEVRLLGPLDHPNGGGENLLSFDVAVTASNGTTSSSSLLNVTVEDDAPLAFAQTRAIDVPQQDTNLMVVLDVSGSMTSGSVDRLAAARTAITNLINAYDGQGDVAVKIVTFSTLANDTTSYWMTADDAKAMLASITAAGWTNYDAALAQAIDAWGSAGRILTPPAGGSLQNVAYFISDGQPNENDGNTGALVNSDAGSRTGPDVGIQAAEEAIWQNFLTTNSIKAFALGLGTGLTAADQTYLDPVAYDGQTGTNMDALMVPDETQLSAALQSTVVPIAMGNVLSGATPGSVGADQGHLQSVTMNGITYTWNTASNTIATSGGTSAATFNGTTHVLTVTTVAGGLLTVDMDNGEYSYRPPFSGSGAMTEMFGFTLIDRDGDTGTGSVTLNITFDQGAPTMVGTSSGNTLNGTAGDDIISGLAGNDTINGGDGNDWLSGGDGNDVLNGGNGNDKLVGGNGSDTLNGGAGDDLLIGGAGNDTMTGGLGADVFQWSLADAGTISSPARDTITDFDVALPSAGGDILDLRDLLQAPVGATAAALDNFLHFQYSGGNTTIYVSTSGAFNDNNSAGGLPSNVSNNDVQQIVLNGVNLTAGFSTDQQVIQDLLTKGKLITD